MFISENTASSYLQNLIRWQNMSNLYIQMRKLHWNRVSQHKTSNRKLLLNDKHLRNVKSGAYCFRVYGPALGSMLEKNSELSSILPLYPQADLVPVQSDAFGSPPGRQLLLVAPVAWYKMLSIWEMFHHPLTATEESGLGDSSQHT